MRINMSKFSLIILGFSLFFTLILVIVGSVGSNSSKIDIRILDHQIGWCGGTINHSGAITHWDVFYSISSFTLGVANFDTTSHVLEQITITKTGYYIANGSQFKINKSISDQGELPVTLLPQRYWSRNFTCESCTYKIALQLIVDGTIIDFGVITAEGFHAKWLTSWTNVIYHTITTSTSFPTLSFLIPLFGVIVVFRGWCKKK